MNISPDTFRLVLHAMVILAAIVFVALYKVKAGYGILLNEKWGLRFPTNWHGCLWRPLFS